MTMTDDEAHTLIRLAESLERAARQLRELAGGPGRPPRQKSSSLPQGFVSGLRAAQRSVASQQLASLSHTQLGDVFAQVGGASRDKRRSKDWLVERILWYLFDFQAGHEMIKGSK